MLISFPVFSKIANNEVDDDGVPKLDERNGSKGRISPFEDKGNEYVE